MLTVGGEVHIARPQGGLKRARDSFLAGTLHVEAGFTLALSEGHARIQAACRHHVAQALDQEVVGEVVFEERRPRTNRLAVAVEDANDRIRHILDVGGIDIDRRTSGFVGARDLDMREIGLVARPNSGLWHMKT